MVVNLDNRNNSSSNHSYSRIVTNNKYYVISNSRFRCRVRGVGSGIRGLFGKSPHERFLVG